MDLQYFGGNCVRIKTKKASLVIDDNLSALGAKSVTKPDDVTLITNLELDANRSGRLVIDSPGEFEVSDVSIMGIEARAHMDEADKPKAAVIYKLIADDLSVVVLGHVHPNITDDELEAIGSLVDVLIVPVGGNGYTLDPVGALEVIKKIEPKLIIPTHYNDKSLKYPVPQQELEAALQALSMEPKETTPKLKIKPAELAETTQLVVLEKQ